MREHHSHEAIEETVRAFFSFYDIDYTLDNVEHMLVLLEVLRVYNQRSQSYGQAWKQYGALSNLLSVARKADRLMAVWWHKAEEYIGHGGKPVIHKDSLDDAVDLVNYAIFFMRNARASNFTGIEPARPVFADLVTEEDDGK